MSKEQREQLWLLPHAGQPRTELVADVALARRTFDLQAYAIPPELAPAAQLGRRVEAPFGRARGVVSGWITRLSEQPWLQTRPALRAIAEEPPLLNAHLLELAQWVSHYYQCPPGLTLAALAPAVLRLKGATARVVRAAPGAQPEKLSALQRRAWEMLRDGAPQRRGALLRLGVSSAVLSALRRKGLIVEDVVSAAPQATAPPVSLTEQQTGALEDELQLTQSQQAALQTLGDAVRGGGFAPHLLFGVPGSGKTEVYVRAARQVIAAGRQVILLIPEIALATQIVDRLARRFARVAVLHSRLSPRVRAETLRAIAGGGVDIVIGTRTAVFAPCPSLGLLIVDEEQEASFKNIAAPYFHARDVAVKRAQLLDIPVVLGSATPSLESWHNARSRQYLLLRLPTRIPGAGVPDVLLTPFAPQTGGLLSAPLATALCETLAAGRQVMLLHNRRGYAAHLRCLRCGMRLACPRCRVTLVYHRGEDALRCHPCGARSAAPSVCPDSSCAGKLEFSRMAIQKLEEELARLAPAARVLRLDRDTMRRRSDYAAALQRFARREADVLIGTQMIAKGLDFADVGLVGVIDADQTLMLPDFRAAERTFQMLVQVAGRAGRHAGSSRVIIQAQASSAPLLRQAVALDVEGFLEQEWQLRQQRFEPPSVRLVRLVLADARPHRAKQEAQRMDAPLRALAAGVHAGIRVDPAQPCAALRQRDMQRWELRIRAPRGADVQRLLGEARRARLLSPRVQRFSLVVDPAEML